MQLIPVRRAGVGSDSLISAANVKLRDCERSSIKSETPITHSNLLSFYHASYVLLQEVYRLEK